MRCVRLRVAMGALGTAVAVLSAVGAASAQAAPVFHCEASALRATAAAGPTIEPAVQGRAGDCATTEATLPLTLPALAALPTPLNASALTASTHYDPTAGTGSATGAIADLQVGASPALLDQALAPVRQAIDQLPPITLPLLQVPIPGLPSITGVTLDVRDALTALLPGAGTSLLSAQLLRAQANVACSGGGVSLSGTSQVAGVKLLGQDVAIDSVAEQALTLFDGAGLSLADLDLSKITILDATGATQLAGPTLAAARAAIQPLLAAITIPLPSSVLDVRLVANEQSTDGRALTQRALHASISLLGQPVLDAVLGEAGVSALAGTCATPAAPAAAAPVKAPVAAQSVADQLLACSDRKLVLVDVLKQDGHVKLLGAANRSYVGKQVAIRLRATGKVVAHAKVAKDGSFQTTASLPPTAYTATHAKANRVRYRAEIGKERSLPLKLQRRLIVSSLTSKAGKVTISGRVVRPLTTPVSAIRLVRRVSCHKVVLVKRFKPSADGTFRVTVKAPAGQSAAIYRMATDVREKASNPRSYPTFTLPRGVALNTR
jgi:hypothetical protein